MAAPRLPPSQWFLARDKTKYGPFPVAQMSQMAATGQLLPTDMVLEEGENQWSRASQVQAFFPATSTAPMPPPVTPVASEPAEWHCIKNGQQTGPAPWSQLQQLAASGQLRPSDMVWKNGTPAWVAASSIQNLFSPQPAPSSPPPPPNVVGEAAPKAKESRFCRNCGKAVACDAIACLSCGLAPDNGKTYCPGCGAGANPQAVICVKCGGGLQAVKVGRAVKTVGADAGTSSGLVMPSDPPKDPVLMCVLSCCLFGLGQLILGQTAKGITLFAGTIAFCMVTCGYGLILVPVIWVVSGMDAYKIAKKLKEGTPVGAWEFF